MKKTWKVFRALDPLDLERILNLLENKGYEIFSVLVTALDEHKPGGEGCVGRFEIVAWRK
jgi:hypothetical protein